MIDLYMWGTANGLRAAVALAECGLEHKVHKVDLTKGEQKAPEFLKLNPLGAIPVLVDHDGPNGKPPDRPAITHRNSPPEAVALNPSCDVVPSGPSTTPPPLTRAPLDADACVLWTNEPRQTSDARTTVATGRFAILIDTSSPKRVPLL